MSTLGKYELIEELNSGSMGTVYAARDNVLDRRVAVKTILPGSHLDAELKERFYREARACARLHHPSIVTIYDFGEEQGTAYIAMELLTGTDVRRIIQERRPLPLEVKLDLGAMVAEGLAHAHAEGIIHRDVKPSNIFVTEDGRAKVLDFGIARTAASSLTMVGRVLGTPNYMAPEQILGKPCDARSDLFSAAIVLYELIAYTHPFQGPSIPKRIVRETADPLRSRFPGAPAGVEAILTKALAKEPEQRYQSGAALAKDLREASEEIKMAARTASSQVSKAEMFAPSRTSTNAPVPPLDSDGTEVLMSRVLTALQEFDEAVDRQDVAGAKRAFESVKKAALGDERFEGAVQRSQERLWDLERSAPPPAAPAPTQGTSHRPEPAAPSTSVKAPERPAPEEEKTVTTAPPPVEPSVMAPPPSGRVDASPTMLFKQELAAQVSRSPEPAAHPASDDPTIGYAPRPSTAPVRTPEPAPWQAQPSAYANAGGDVTALFGGGSVHPSKAAPLSAQAPPPKPTPIAATPVKPGAAIPLPPKPVQGPARAQPPAKLVGKSDAASSKKMIIAVAAVVVFLILAAGGYFLFSQRQPPPKVEAFVATAHVTAGQTDIVSSVASGAAIVANVHRGNSIHVLRIPRNSTQTWTEVQYIGGGKTYPRGYARTSDLGDWTSSKPEVELNLLRAFAPAVGATEAELLAGLTKLDGFLNQFRNSPQAVEAQLDMARLNVELARIAAAAGRPTSPYVEAAQNELAKAGARAELASQIQELKQDLDALAQKPNGSQPAGVSPIQGSTPGQPGAPASGLKVPPATAIKLARTDADNGKYDEAMWYLRQVLKIQPANQEAKVLLDRVQRAQDYEGKQ